MTKRPQKARDFKKYPMTMQEKAEVEGHMRRLERQLARIEKKHEFLKRARQHNTERGISPKLRRETHA